jgi:DNA-binding winged helix-turn-helix (wHTH) protein/tetratricopeptide (TPR) repeat protein
MIDTATVANLDAVMYRFGEVTIDTSTREVRVDGIARPTEPQVLGVLTHLIEQRHRVVTKDELLDEVWGTRFVSAAAVTSRIKSARQAIGDTGRSQSMIRTIHGRGYRFVAELESDSAPRPNRPAPASAASRTFDDGWPLIGRDSDRDRAIGDAVRGDGGGLLLTGPAGLGKTRLARAILEGVAARGVPVARINGHLGATSVPLAALAHLLPADVTEIAGLQGELARTVLLQRARAAIATLGGDRQMVLMVDDVDRVDSLSKTLLASLITDHTVFAVMTQRVTDADAETLALEHLVGSGAVRRISLAPIPEDQMIALMGRVLDGPVQPMTGHALVAASNGFPGMLRQLIEASISSGQLSIRNGVWRLHGGLTPPGDMTAAIRRRVDGLDDDQRDALELLAIAGDLHLDLAFELVSDEVLDQLELEGMISVREIGTSTRLRLAHPLYGEILTAAISPLRDLRHRSRLAAALAAHPSNSAADRLQLVRLQLDNDAPVDDGMLVESAALALIESDSSLALRLLRAVPPERRTVRHQQLYGEVLYMRGRFDEAAEVWQSMDRDDLDDETAAGVVRRIATWMFYGAWRYDDAIDFLDQQMQRFEGRNRMSLESYWTLIAAIDGCRAEAVIERTERLLPQADGHSAADLLAGAAMAHFVRGRYLRTLELLDESNERRIGLERTIHWTNAAYANMVEILAHLELGDPTAAWTTFERVTEPGAPPDFGFAAIAAGRMALACGRWQQTIDWLEPKIQITEALGITTNGRPLQATAGVAALMLGNRELAAETAAAIRSDLPIATNNTSLDLTWAVLRIEGVTSGSSGAADEAVRAAERAREHGLISMESRLCGTAVHLGAAERVVDRLEVLAGDVDGDLARLRYRSALAALGRDDPANVLAALDERGLVFESASLRAALTI